MELKRLLYVAEHYYVNVQTRRNLHPPKRDLKRTRQPTDFLESFVEPEHGHFLDTFVEPELGHVRAQSNQKQFK